MDKLYPGEVEALSDLLMHEGWPLIQRLITDRIEDRTRQLVGGRASSFDEYQSLCGAIRELVYLRDRPTQLIDTARRIA